jgi:hypothetical protein
MTRFPVLVLSLLCGSFQCGCGSDGTPKSAAPGTGGSAATNDGDGAGGSPTATAGGSTGGAGGTGTVALDFDPTEQDFKCILNGTKVRSFYVTNGLGKMDETLAIANSADGGTYPVGTMIQLVPFEAMVKRKTGFSAATNDWEFFSLTAATTGTTIVSRGTTDVINQFNGNCFDCHKKADPKFDLVCEETHGCDPLPLTPQLIDSLQKGDARCP